MPKMGFSPSFIFICLSLDIMLPNAASGDWIRGNFATTFVGTSADNTCPGSAKSRNTYAGPGFGTINFENIYIPDHGEDYSANITYSFCNGTGSVVTGGIFTVDGGKAGSFGGRFDGNYVTANGNSFDDGEFRITSETGIFSNVDLTGFFDLGTNIPAEMGTGTNVFLYTPEPAAIGLAACGAALLLLLMRRRAVSTRE